MKIFDNNLSLLCLSITLLATSTQKVQAQVYINANTTINNTISSDVIVGQSGHGGVTNPVLDAIVGADVQGSLYTFNTSTMNMNGGTINNALTVNNSTVNMNGGTIRTLQIFDNSTANISGGTVSSVLYTARTSVTNISGGSIENLYPFNNSTVNINGGVFNYLLASDSSTVNINSGIVNNTLYNNNAATLNLSGGTVGDLYLYDSSVYNIYGPNLTSTLIGTNVSAGGALNTGDLFSQYTLDGTLADGTDITGKSLFVVNGSTGSFNLLSSVTAPEPSTIALCIMGGMGFITTKRRKAL
jgi:hypothetical protein